MTKNFSILEALSFGWRLTKNNFWFFAKIILVLLVLFFLSQLIFVVSSKYELPPLIDSFLFLVDVFLFCLLVIFQIGLIKISLDFVFERKTDFAELFKNYKLFFPYFLAQILYGLIVFLGFLLFLVPGFIWAIKYVFFGYCLIDKKIGPFQALKASAKLTEGVKWQLFLFFFLANLIMLASALFFGLGLLVVAPVISLSFAFVYKKLLEQTQEFKNSSNVSLSPSKKPLDLMVAS
jgi:uncharacterized membrane protein